MGNAYTYMTESTFYIWSREKSTDAYAQLFTVEDGANPLSRFKHEVYAYALNKKHANKKSLYLYCGYARVAKCSRSVESDVPYITVEFGTPDYAAMWDECREQIPKVVKDMSWLQDSFSKSWVFHQCDNESQRKYQNYRMNL
jgi:hypothetical protein